MTRDQERAYARTFYNDDGSPKEDPRAEAACDDYSESDLTPYEQRVARLDGIGKGLAARDRRVAAIERRRKTAQKGGA